MKFCLSLLILSLLQLYAQELPPPPDILASPPKPLTRTEVGALIRSAAAKHNLPPALVKSVVAAESAFQVDAVSPKGAIGLMQVMPATALEMGLDPTIPEENIEAGTRYLAQLIGHYRENCRDWLRRAIAAYNAGPANVDKYKGVPPFQETRAYVARVLAFLRFYTNHRLRASSK
jgi:soluble lytic murein transglycosylase-like protein